MGSLANYGEQFALQHVVAGSQTAPSTVYLALCTADPTDAATGASCNEVPNSGSYARIAITFGAAASREIANNSDLSYAAATGSWGTITHWVVTDSGTYGAGNVLAHGGFTVSKAIVSGNTPTVASGSVQVEWSTSSTQTWSDYLVHKLLDFMFRNQAFTQPATYVTVTTATIASTDTGSTITQASGISRVLINKYGGASPAWSNPSGGSCNNANDVTISGFNASETLVAVAVVDASSAGNLLMFDDTMTDQAVGSGDTFRFTATNLTASVS